MVTCAAVDRVLWNNLSQEVIDMPTTSVALTEQQQQFIESLLESGRFESASDVLSDGLRLLQQREENDVIWL